MKQSICVQISFNKNANKAICSANNLQTMANAFKLSLFFATAAAAAASFSVAECVCSSVFTATSNPTEHDKRRTTEQHWRQQWQHRAHKHWHR